MSSWRGALFTLLAVSLFLRAIWLDQPGSALIFDEAYYVNAARTIAGWPVPAGQHYAGSPPYQDPNVEHPALGKVILSLSMERLEDTPLGWRTPSIMAGLVSIALLFAVV